MPTYIKGEPVANATLYELYKKSSGNYDKLAENTEINFEVSTLGLSAGNHTLVVKAKASGYEDSDYSNEVVYVSNDIRGSLTFTNTGCGAPDRFPEQYIAEFRAGKIYSFTITTDYDGTLEFYPATADLTKGGIAALRKYNVQAGVPLTGTITIPHKVQYEGGSEYIIGGIGFRSRISNQVNYTYAFICIGDVDLSCFEGTVTAAGTTALQPIYDFEPGASYSYEVTPNYDGRFLIYSGCSNMNNANAFDLNSGTLVDTTVTNGTVLTGTFTMPTAAHATSKCLPDTISFRTYLTGAQFSYKITKVS